MEIDLSNQFQNLVALGCNNEEIMEVKKFANTLLGMEGVYEGLKREVIGSTLQWRVVENFVELHGFMLGGAKIFLNKCYADWEMG